MALTAFQEKPREVQAAQFTGDAASAALVQNDIRAAGSDIEIRENPRIQGQFIVRYGKQMTVDRQGNQTTRTGTKRIRLRNGDYIIPKGANSCTVMSQAEFTAKWEAAP